MKRIISIFLLTAILFSTISFYPVQATTHNYVDLSTKNQSIAIFNDTNIPEAININELMENNSLYRLNQKEEDMNTIVFGNSDGSETTYLFNEPVKYVDESGSIKDKSNKLYPISEQNASFIHTENQNINEYAFVNSDNDVRTFFPNELSLNNSIVIESESIGISMSPYSSNNITLAIDNNDVYYEGAFGEFTTLRYQTLFNGLKEDIILEKNVGNSFKFIFDIGNYKPVLSNNQVYLQSKDGLCVATINPIYVYSSSKDKAQFTYNNHFVINENSDGKYEVTIYVDNDFLSNPDTVFPVYVDPTITINATGSGSNKTILDLPLYNGSSVSNEITGNNSLGLIGKVDSTYGSGRLLMRFPGLMNKAFMNTNYTITNAKLIMQEVSGQTTKGSIAAYQYTGPDWDETTTYNSSMWNGVGSIVDWKRFYYPDHTSEFFSFLSVIKNWQSNHSIGNKGIILKNMSTESDYTKTKTMYTSEGVTKPYISVTYFFNGVKGIRSTPQTNYKNYNCQSYAFWRTPTPGTYDFTQFTRLYNSDGSINYNSDQYYCMNTTVPLALERTKTRMTAWLNSKFPNKWRTVSGYNSQLNSDEWLVAMRIGVGDYDNDGITDFDYHFWYRANNGKWYNKHGYYAASEMVSGDVVDPSISNSSNGWKLNNITNYYSSSTIYYAVKA